MISECIIASCHNTRFDVGDRYPDPLAGGNEREILVLNARYSYGVDWPSNFNLVEFTRSVKQDVNVRLAIIFECIEKSQSTAVGYADVYRN
jgi:hypothetical protein